MKYNNDEITLKQRLSLEAAFSGSDPLPDITYLLNEPHKLQISL